MEHPFSNEVPELLQKHLDHLLASGISLEVIRERGYKTVMGRTELKEAGFSKSQQRAPGILIPLHAPDFTPASFLYRPDNPRMSEKEKPIKYEAPASSSQRLDMPKRCYTEIGNPGVPLWITEGAKKADALASHGACAISLNGVWGFKGKNEFGATALLADFDLIAWKDRAVYLVFDSDSATNPHVKKALERLSEHIRRKGSQVKVVNLPGVLNGEKVGADDYLATGHTLDDLVKLISDDTPEAEKEPVALHNPVYAIHEGRLCLIRNTRDIGKVYSPLCNFTAEIVDEVIHDDGIAEARQFVVNGKLSTGRPMRRIEVPATDFAGLGWVSKEWGAKAVIHAGSSVKDHLRCVIQMSTNGHEPRRVFTHTGWREIDGDRFFLTASGALGKEGVEVALKGPLARYQLPVDMDRVESLEAVKASISFMDFGKHEVMCPLWAEMYLAPLVEILNPAFTVWLYGHTGSFKSVLSALALCHFGDFTHLTLPASWRDTANRLEWAMAMLKDLPLVIDDWHPAPTVAAQRDLEAKAEIVVRGQGNRAGRGRLRADASPMESYTPRGLVVATGEQLPSGESHASRLFVLEPEPGDIDGGLLTFAQKEAGLYKYAMARYILWLKSNWDSLRESLPSRWEEWRDKALAEDTHLRLPAAVAWLYAGLDLGLTFAQETGAISPAEFDERTKAGWTTLVELASRQGSRVNEERPARRFIEAFNTLMDQQRLVLICKDSIEYEGELRPGQVFVGWRDATHLYLLPKAVYGAVYDFCNRSGDPFTFKEQAVWKDLVRIGVAQSQNEATSLYKVRVGQRCERSEVRWLLKLQSSAVLPEKGETA